MRAELWEARCAAHEVFDRLWLNADPRLLHRNREICYRWLSMVTGIPEDHCHFANFDCGLCEAVIALIWEVRRGVLPGPAVIHDGGNYNCKIRSHRRVARLCNYWNGNAPSHSVHSGVP